MARVQLEISDRDRDRFVAQARREGVSLSAWLRAAGEDRLQRRAESARFDSAEVLQELLLAYLPVGRSQTLADAMALLTRMGLEVWPLEREDVEAAMALQAQFPALDARDLCHLACCRRRQVTRIKTFDQALGSLSS